LLELGPPDDVLMPQLIERAFERHLLHAKPEVVAWLAKRIERSHVAILRVADVLEMEAADTRLSIPAMRVVLAANGLITATDDP
jgi:chromosomal replication initiation ATPase DnaA